MAASSVSSSRPVYAVKYILPAFVPGDRLDDKLPRDLVELMLRDGRASYRRPKGS